MLVLKEHVSFNSHHFRLSISEILHLVYRPFRNLHLPPLLPVIGISNFTSATVRPPSLRRYQAPAAYTLIFPGLEMLRSCPCPL